MRDLSDLLRTRRHLLALNPGLFAAPEQKMLSADNNNATHAEGLHIPYWASEHEFQAAVIAERDLRALTQPEYELLVAIPNGQYRSGQRMEPGIVAGAPDLALFVPRGRFGSLSIELKISGGKCSKKQLEFHDKLRSAGNHVVVVWDSVEEVFRHLDHYLSLPRG